MKNPISPIIEQLGRLLVLSWFGGHPPYQVWKRDTLHTPWFKVGPTTNDTFTILQNVGDSGFFIVEALGSVARDNYLILSMDGISADVEIENPQDVLTYSNNGYRFCYARNCPGLIGLVVNSNRLEVFDIYGSTNVKQVRAANNKIEAFDFSTNPDLSTVEFGNNPVTAWPLANHAELYKCSCEECLIPEFDLSKNVKLVSFAPYLNPFTELGTIKACRNIMHLDVGNTPTLTQDALNQILVEVNGFGTSGGTLEMWGMWPTGVGIPAAEAMASRQWKLGYKAPP